MILNYEVTNWACFADTVRFSMEAGPERDPMGKLARVGSKSRPLKVLPMAAIYGNNASGKTQFIESLLFLRNLMLGEYKAKRIPRSPFALDSMSTGRMTSFVLQFIIEAQIYELSIDLTDVEIISEELSVFSTRAKDKTLLYRRKGSAVEERVRGDESFRSYVKGMKIEATRAFLTLSAMLENKDAQIAKVFTWFARTLQIISPSSRYMALEDYCAPGDIGSRAIEYLSRFDTGIARLEPKVVDLGQFSPPLIEELRANLTPGASTRRMIGSSVYVFELTTDSALIAKKLYAVHTAEDGSQMAFPMDMESDGTRRMLDLIPAVCKLKSDACPTVFIVDEIDRNLHHLVTRALIEDFLESCTPEARSQLIFTTHDLLLMDQKICRRDEMWAADKSPDGKSRLTDFSSFAGIRKDTNIRDVYLEGRFGGVPRSL